MFDMEAEEEEEEGQGGLGDFGFGRQSDINDQIDETVAIISLTQIKNSNPYCRMLYV